MNEELMQDMKVSGKGEKARNNVNAARSDIDALQKTLGRIVDVYKSFNMEEGGKRRSMVDDMPARIEFNKNGLRLYIDFTLQAAHSGEDRDVEGVIIYGANRTLCFKNWPFGEKTDSGLPQKTEDLRYCDRITRCDGFEDKPLLRFTVNRHGRIRSVEIDDEWWIVPEETNNTQDEKVDKEKKNREALSDLHYRAIDRIWSDALDWTNENILP